ncbi:hypothetical protein D3C83_297910 [compost metagenome]
MELSQESLCREMRFGSVECADLNALCASLAQIQLPMALDLRVGVIFARFGVDHDHPETLESA